ncbi:transcriptional regulator, MarR family [Methanocaldococcus vulcanius M7]|uniref:Transcriptional regulator, MarR family n=1 Tax=Methanocaldococcus vulcanius (strain ATCC 700851 / DSM 12094 / M7) TaxID=579137 RepID=C9RI68_METVM|nr:transcriptional regulator [Methanocaldococcus vulcanius]ACX73270.1 transcriptional regulator, MarR family [Methanocaldococcus vulcanius M7]
MKVFNSVVRVKILALLYGLEYCEFSYLKEKLNLTDGNLEHHLKKLEEIGFIETKKSLIKGKIKTIIKITEKGRTAFKNYIYEILQLSKNIES